MSQAGSASGGGGGGGTPISTLTGNTGGAVSPTGGNINVVGSGVVSVTGNPGTSTLTISTSGALSDSFPTDAGTATPIAGELEILGGSNINTSGATNVVTVNLDNTISITGSITCASFVDVGSGYFQTTGPTVLRDGGSGNSLFTFPETNNTFVGLVAGNIGLTGDDNTGIGFAALNPVTTAQRCAAVGSRSQENNDTGNENTSVGYLTLNAVNGAGVNNTVMGSQSGQSLSTGTDNTAVGRFALRVIGTGSYNSCLGSGAGSSLTTSESDNILISNSGTIGDNNTIRIGTQGTGNAQQDSCFIAGIRGVTPAMSPEMVTIGSDGELGSQAIASGGITTLDGDTGSATGSTVTIAGGTGITTSATAATVTIDNDGVITINGDSGSATGNTITIAGGTNVTTSATGSTVTIDASGGSSFTWSEQTGTTQAMAVGNGYILNNAGLVTATLPATAAVGDLMEIVGKGAGGWLMAQNSGQTVHFGDQDTTTGAGGSLASTGRYDCISIICTTADTDFVIKSSNGNITVV